MSIRSVGSNVKRLNIHLLTLSGRSAKEQFPKANHRMDDKGDGMLTIARNDGRVVRISGDVEPRGIISD